MSGLRSKQPADPLLGALGQLTDFRRPGRQCGREILPAQTLLEQCLAGDLPEAKQSVQIAGHCGQPAVLLHQFGKLCLGAGDCSTAGRFEVLSEGLLELGTPFDGLVPPQCGGLFGLHSGTNGSGSCGGRRRFRTPRVVGRAADRARVTVGQGHRKFGRHPRDPSLDQGLPAIDRSLVQVGRSSRSSNGSGDFNLSLSRTSRRLQYIFGFGQLPLHQRKLIACRPSTVDPTLELGNPGRQTG
jgi:hypothetical protein